MKSFTHKLWKENKTFVIFLVLMVFFRSAFADWNHVPSGSMKPTIVEGDRIFISKVAYDLRIPFTETILHHFNNPKRGDVIVFESKASDKRLVKRLIGLPGDVISMRDNRLYINGQAAEYSDISSTTSTTDLTESLLGVERTIRIKNNGSQASNFGAIVVPEGHYFAMGDNRDNSIDSRFIGFVPHNEIIGQANGIAFSLNYDNFMMPRSDRFFHAL